MNIERLRPKGHYQCWLEKVLPDGAVLCQMAWIPKTVAAQGAVINLQGPDGQGWTVKEVYREGAR